MAEDGRDYWLLGIIYSNLPSSSRITWSTLSRIAFGWVLNIFREDSTTSLGNFPIEMCFPPPPPNSLLLFTYNLNLHIISLARLWAPICAGLFPGGESCLWCPGCNGKKRWCWQPCSVWYLFSFAASCAGVKRLRGSGYRDVCHVSS